MVLLLLSAGQGPAECCLAVSRAFKIVHQEATELGVCLTILEEEPGPKKNTYKSILCKVEGDSSLELVAKWSGTLQWICTSPFRPKHKRKNWFFTGSFKVVEQLDLTSEIKFETFRASGPGGQHVNKTNSAVRATHVATGISVRVQSERSQHANKKLACTLIQVKLDTLKEEESSQSKSERHKSHHLIERGNAIRVFKGKGFVDEMV